ncbi:MAG: hypothetical protein HC813_00775 [Planctomycetes bacterium]|nr:hypothetical protein [Planctomycetota bacterium]
MKVFVALLLTGVVVAAFVWSDEIFGGSAAAATNGSGRATHTVRRGNLLISITERGTLKTLKSTQIRAETNAKIQSIVAEGTKVKQGEVLVELDKTDAQRELEQFANQVTQLKAELKSATTEQTIQIDQNKTDMEKARLDLEIKTVEETKLLEADIPAEERKLKLSIEEAETALDRARDDVKASARLLEEKFVTENDHKQTLLNLKKAENTLQTAEMEKVSYERFKRPLDIRQKREAVEEAKRGWNGRRSAPRRSSPPRRRSSSRRPSPLPASRTSTSRRPRSSRR